MLKGPFDCDMFQALSFHVRNLKTTKSRRSTNETFPNIPDSARKTSQLYSGNPLRMKDLLLKTNIIASKIFPTAFYQLPLTIYLSRQQEGPQTFWSRQKKEKFLNAGSVDVPQRSDCFSATLFIVRS
ncbi:hypothetical protein AVEN_175915-1 [Araneus ventricosus]|uniref:Uncharacterized protein n=1 Tax=Araneus ventricosus TaxID=182803 RepID=A0A4Y2JJT9_ARAVE|nr:hypothetical protein AVEN_175915-1 [Araneus ventricosus]